MRLFSNFDVQRSTLASLMIANLLGTIPAVGERSK